MTQEFVIMVEPMGAPRMTRADAWKKREVVVRYHAFKDKMRAACKGIMAAPSSVSWVAYFPIPGSWSQKKQKAAAGTIHTTKPDRDNVDKGILDALFEQDQCVAAGEITKRYDDGKGCRIELFVADEDFDGIAFALWRNRTRSGVGVPHLLDRQVAGHPAAGLLPNLRN